MTLFPVTLRRRSEAEASKGDGSQKRI